VVREREAPRVELLTQHNIRARLQGVIERCVDSSRRATLSIIQAHHIHNDTLKYLKYFTVVTVDAETRPLRPDTFTLDPPPQPTRY
jgi:hypothetical protein